MEMKPEEIVRRYKMADNKGQIVRILSELNAVSQEDIRTVIRGAGIDVGNPGRKKKERTVKKQNAKKKEEVMKMDGKNIVQVPDVVISLAIKEMERIETEMKELQDYMIQCEHKRAEIEVWIEAVKEQTVE